MAGVGEASGIAGLITLAIQVTGTITEYVTAVKDKSKNIRELRDELELLGEVLSRLKDTMAREQSNGRSFDQHSVLRKAIRDCTERIERVGDKLRPPENGKLGRAWDRFKWPFEQKDVIQLMENLRRFTNIFQFAVTNEGISIVSQASEEATKRLKETLDKLNESSIMLSAVGVSVVGISMQMKRVEQIISLVPHLEEASSGIREISYAMRLTEDRELRRRTTEILDWLCPISSLQKHRDIQEKRTTGTGNWFLQEEAFLDWVNIQRTQHELLAVGRPGVGKSVLSSLVFDHLRLIYKDKDTAVVFYYWDYADQQAQTPLNFATSLLRQLAACCNSMPTVVAEFYERTRNDIKDQAWFQELQAVLQRVIATFHQCFFVVDALDETEPGGQREGLFEVLKTIRTSNGVPKIFATTRPHLANIETEFQDVTKIEINASQSDLRVHLGKMIDQHQTARAFMDDALKNEILDKLCSNAHGIFLLPALQIRNVLRHVTRAGVKRALGNLSTKLDQVFESTIERLRGLDSEQRDVAFTTLMWLSHAKRAMHVDELQHALAVGLEDKELDFDNMVPLSTIIDSCCGLVEVVEYSQNQEESRKADETPIIRLVHFSLEEYLRTHSHGIFENGDLQITRLCLKYMGFPSVSSLAPKNRNEFEKEVKRLSLLDYASFQWGHHARNIDIAEIIDLVIPIFTNDRSLLVVARVRDMKSNDFRKWRLRMELWTQSDHCGGGISLAASFGLTDLVRHLIKETAQPKLDARNMYGSTALHEACRLGHHACAEVLIASGADLLDSNNGKNTPIFLAVGSKQLTTVEALLKYGKAQLDVACKEGWTPLHKAADLGDERMITLLLRSGAQVAAQDYKRMTPLHLAARRGHLEAVKLLVLAGAAVHIKANDNFTPLDLATTSGYSNVVEFLLQNGGNIHHKAHDGWSPLHRAARGGHTVTVALLLRRGANLLLPDHKQNIPLHLAIRSGRIELVSLILNYQPNIKQAQLFHKDRKGFTPREVSFFTANYDIHKFLRAAEREFFPVGLNPTASLTAAIEEGNFTEVQHMIDDDPRRLETPDEDGQPPLHVAIQENQLQIAELLLNAGARMQSTGYHNWTALHIAASRGILRLVNLCLQHGAAVNALTTTDQTPLHKACSSNSSDVVRRLLVAGADPETKNDRGMNALMIAAHHNNLDIVRLLVLDWEVEVLRKDNFGDTAASWAEKSGHLEMLAFLKVREKLKRRATGTIGEDVLVS